MFGPAFVESARRSCEHIRPHFFIACVKAFRDNNFQRLLLDVSLVSERCRGKGEFFCDIAPLQPDTGYDPNRIYANTRGAGGSIARGSNH